MNEHFMKEKPVFELILSMSLPMVLSMLVSSLYNIVDSFFVAKISEDAMTALSLVYPVQNLINAVGIGFGVGINSVIALNLGAGKSLRADEAASQGISLSFVHGVILNLCSVALMPAFLGAFTSDPDVIDLGVRYSTVAFSFSVIICLGMAFEKVFQAVGRIHIAMAGLLGGCIANIILDPPSHLRNRPFSRAWHRWRRSGHRLGAGSDPPDIYSRLLYVQAPRKYKEVPPPSGKRYGLKALLHRHTGHT